MTSHAPHTASDAPRIGWRRPIAVMVAVQAVTLLVMSVVLSGAPAAVTAMVLVGWAMSLVMILGLGALMYATDRIAWESSRLRAFLAGAPTDDETPAGPPLARSVHTDRDDVATTPLPVGVADARRETPGVARALSLAQEPLSEEAVAPNPFAGSQVVAAEHSDNSAERRSSAARATLAALAAFPVGSGRGQAPGTRSSDSADSSRVGMPR